MAGYLYGNTGKGNRYNFRDDVLMLLGMIERISEGLTELDVKEDVLYVDGHMDLSQVNRIRRMAGLAELGPAKGEI